MKIDKWVVYLISGIVILLIGCLIWLIISKETQRKDLEQKLSVAVAPVEIQVIKRDTIKEDISYLTAEIDELKRTIDKQYLRIERKDDELDKTKSELANTKLIIDSDEQLRKLFRYASISPKSRD